MGEAISFNRHRVDISVERRLDSSILCVDYDDHHQVSWAEYQPVIRKIDPLTLSLVTDFSRDSAVRIIESIAIEAQQYSRSPAPSSGEWV